MTILPNPAVQYGVQSTASFSALWLSSYQRGSSNWCPGTLFSETITGHIRLWAAFKDGSFFSRSLGIRWNPDTYKVASLFCLIDTDVLSIILSVNLWRKASCKNHHPMFTDGTNRDRESEWLAWRSWSQSISDTGISVSPGPQPMARCCITVSLLHVSRVNGTEY